MNSLYKIVTTILFFAVAAFFSVGCSSAPSESDAQAVLESEGKGLIKLVSFSKTNAILSEVQGVKVYTLEYEATIEFLEDCWWRGPRMGFSWLSKREPRMISLYNRARAGQRELITGEMEFKKTEKGWRGEDGRIY